MKKIFFRLSVVMAAVLSMSACLGDSDSSDYVYYNDTAVLSFSLGTLNRYLTTKASDGSDSTYKATYTGSTYKFYIDQVNHQIYNPDSLPYGTDARHVICTITAMNSGSVGLKSLISDTIFVYSSTDSIDFSQPRHIMVYSQDGSAVRDYSVRVNVHQEQGDEFRWTAKAANATFQGMTAMRGLVAGDRLYVAGSDGTTGILLSTPLSDGDTWTVAKPGFDHPVPPDFAQQLITDDTLLYALDDGKVICSADGDTWQEVAAGPLRQLVGHAAGTFYAIDTDGTLVESADAVTWTAAALDTDMALLPTQDISLAANVLKTDPQSARVVMTGNRAVDAYPGDAWSVTWVKVADTSDAAGASPWMYCPTEPNMYLLPRLRQLTTLTYGEGILALGAEGIGGSTQAAFSQFYYSLDGGLNWQTDSRFVLPDGFASNGAFALATDSDHYLWLIAGGSGQVWRGRLNALGWTEIQRAFR